MCVCGLPAGVIGDPDIADTTGADGVFERGEGLLDGHRVVPDVDLPQIEMIGSQPFERVVELSEHRSP